MELGSEGSEAEVAPSGRRALVSADQMEDEAAGRAPGKPAPTQTKRHKRWTKLIAAVRRDSRGVHLLSQSTAPEMLRVYQTHVLDQDYLHGCKTHDQRFSYGEVCSEAFLAQGGWRAAPNVTTVGLRIISVSKIDSVEGTFRADGVIDGACERSCCRAVAGVN